jgi:hypothetical protein
MKQSGIAIMTVGLALLLGVTIFLLWRRPAEMPGMTQDTRKGLEQAGDSRQDRRILELAREVQALRSRVSARAEEETAAANQHPSGAAEPESDDTEGDLTSLAGPSETDLTPAERRDQRVAFYASAHDAESRDRTAAPPFESSIASSVLENDLGSVERVDCRSTICVLEIRHDDASDRDKLDALFLRGPLKFGAFDYVDEDGRTIAYVGMPGHSLQKTGI